MLPNEILGHAWKNWGDFPFNKCTRTTDTNAHIKFPPQQKVSKKHTPAQTHGSRAFTVSCKLRAASRKSLQPWREEFPLMSSAFVEDAPASCARYQPRLAACEHKRTQGRQPLLYLQRSDLFPLPFSFPIITYNHFPLILHLQILSNNPNRFKLEVVAVVWSPPKQTQQFSMTTIKK